MDGNKNDKQNKIQLLRKKREICDKLEMNFENIPKIDMEAENEIILIQNKSKSKKIKVKENVEKLKEEYNIVKSKRNFYISRKDILKE